jgi:DNA-binding beta-propeller fold protein YncE
MRRAKAVAGAVALTSIVAGCSDAHHPRSRRTSAANPPGKPARKAAAHAIPRLALVTAETRNELIVVKLSSGKVIRRVPMPNDPENVVVGSRIVVVSPKSRIVTLLDPRTLRVTAHVGGFTAPHIAAITPDHAFVYVTDDAAGTVTPIRLADARRFPAVRVGAGAHHLAFSPDGGRVWIVLGETGHEVTICDVSDPRRPRVVGHLRPGYTIHDVLFSPDGSQVWLSSATAPLVTVLDSHTRRRLFTVSVGRPPQHIAFAGGRAILTSGYGARLKSVDARTGRVLAAVRSPYGSFELDATRNYVVTSSLLNGTVAIWNGRLRLTRTLRPAPATRDLAILTGG